MKTKNYLAIAVMVGCLGCKQVEPPKPTDPEIVRLQHRVYDLEQRMDALEQARTSINCTTTGSSSSCITSNHGSITINGEPK